MLLLVSYVSKSISCNKEKHSSDDIKRMGSYGSLSYTYMLAS